MKRSAAALLLAGIAFVFSAAASLQRVDAVSVGKGPQHAAADPVTGRVFVANGGRAGEAGSLAVLDPGGRLTTLATSAGVSHMVLTARHRRAVLVHPSANQATVIDVDTLQSRTVMTGIGPSRALVVEGTGIAYVIGAGLRTGSGSITEIDLRSGFARTFPVPGLAPVGLVASAGGSHLFLLGTAQPYTGPWMPGIVLAFDTRTRIVDGLPARVGVAPRQILAGAGGEVYVVGHLEAGRAALYVLDGGLEVLRALALSESRDLDRPTIGGRAELDPQTHHVYLLDADRTRLLVVDPLSGHVESTKLEAPGQALAVNAVAETVLVSLASGHLGIFSLAGERLDTVPIARAPATQAPAARHDIAVDAASGHAFVTNAHAGSISIVRRDAGTPPAVVNFTDLWIDPVQPGWGVFVDQQGATMFATLFTHDPGGRPTWLFMSNGARLGDGAFAGDLHRTRGPVAEALKHVVAVGTLRFEPTAANAATLTYYVDGGLHTRQVQRFRLGDAPRDCRWSAEAPKALAENANYTALWANPADPGWGLAVSHQGDATFGVLFTYDEQNRPTWFVMSNGRIDAQGRFGGAVYRAMEERIQLAGQMSLAFNGSDSGVLRYRLGGLDFRGPILRQTFSPLTSHCTS